ncbi:MULTISPECIES: hypothetical protein [unclassified Pseudomonas]|uniref:hypothetical protein n=1 Tax=unclassified Pseudomonas TaxID=196821 RepID=UPI001C6090BE|nr:MULTISPECIES: hypothetical protein [unclassified Pseudomonas]MBW5416069.1 hypothetical protein [Pseudomonas sp. MAG002Y]
MAKIYGFINGGSAGNLWAMALAEDGHVLAEHVSSTVYWAKHDLGIGSTWKHELYDQHYGAGNWELEWIEDTNVNDGFQQALLRNERLPKT